MEYTDKYSKGSRKMKASKIRELMKYAAMPDVISFSGGMPDPDNFPINDVNEIITGWDSTKAKQAMQYGPTTGYPPLVENLKRRMEDKKGIELKGQELIITTGAQQGLFLLSRVFLDPGDTILVEEPSFIGGVASFLACQAELISIPLLDDGLDLVELEKRIEKLTLEGRAPKFIYTIPNFQNPSGVTLSQSKRRGLYELAIKYSLPIIEDDPYGDLYFEGSEADYMPIKSLGNEAPIIYVGSFSKILGPGLRLGWILGDKEVIDRAGLVKQSIDACSASFSQVVASDYLEKNIVEKYLEKMRAVYKGKRDEMLAEIKKHFPSSIKHTEPKGGFFIYVELPQHISGEELFKAAIEEKVAFVTGEPFHLNKEEGDRRLRLAYSNSSSEDIKKGIEVIGRLLNEKL